MRSRMGGLDSAEEADAFFASFPEDPALAPSVERLKTFLQRVGVDTPIALVTSGGTTAPLERTAVRFVDNFSSGSRGAASAEYLLRAGYAVVFLHREGSLRPFDRKIPDAARWFYDSLVSAYDANGIAPPHGLDWHGNSILDMLQTSTANLDRPGVCAESLAREALRGKIDLGGHFNMINRGTLLAVPFTTLFQYLNLLRALCTEMSSVPKPRRVMVYLAAAVSDFYVPWERLPTHKIQSREAGDAGPSNLPGIDATDDGGVVIRLSQTPKMLGHVRSAWCPNAFVVGFKLETDPDILLEKANRSLVKYRMHLVVANEMHRRKDRVALVEPEGKSTWVNRPADMADIEELLIGELARRHAKFVLAHSG